jgi:hypothetical protein
MINFSQVLEGWRNKLIPPSELKDFIEKTSSERINICLNCPHHSKNHKTIRPDDHCTNCGCTLSAKTRCLSCSCPLNKWVGVVTQEQEEELKTSINEQGNKT